MRAIIAVCAVFSLSLSCAADQWWVGGNSGDWSGNNWASEKDGTGAAWTSGDTGWFSLSPVTIDLNGASPSVSCFKTTGFTADNPCRIAIKNTSSTKPTISFSGLNKSSGDDFANAVVEFSNVAVKDASEPLRLANGTHFHLNDGSTLKKYGYTDNKYSILVGYDSATSNSLYIAKGSTLEFQKNLYIGCGSDKTVAPTGVVYVAGTLKLDWNIYMGRTYANHISGCAGRGVLIVDGGTVETVQNDALFHVGAHYVDGGQYNQTSEIIVRNGGLLKIKKDFIRREYSGGQSIVVDGGTLSVGTDFYCTDESKKNNYIRNATTTVKNGGVFALGGIFKPNNYSSGSDSYCFDGGIFRALNNVSVWTQNPADFTVGENGMQIDTNGYVIRWYSSINKGTGKVSKVGAGTLNLQCTSHNSAGWEVAQGVLCIEKNNNVYTRVNGGELTVLNGATLMNGSSNKPTNGLADRILLKEGAIVSASVNTAAQCIFGKDVEIEGPVNVSFDGELAEGVDYPVLTKTGDSVFTDADAALCRPAAGTAHAGQVRFRCSSDGKTIYARRVKYFIILFR